MEAFHELISSEDTGAQMKENEFGGVCCIHRIGVDMYRGFRREILQESERWKQRLTKEKNIEVDLEERVWRIRTVFI